MRRFRIIYSPQSWSINSYVYILFKYNKKRMHFINASVFYYNVFYGL